MRAANVVRHPLWTAGTIARGLAAAARPGNRPAGGRSPRAARVSAAPVGANATVVRRARRVGCHSLDRSGQPAPSGVRGDALSPASRPGVQREGARRRVLRLRLRPFPSGLAGAATASRVHVRGARRRAGGRHGLARRSHRLDRSGLAMDRSALAYGDDSAPRLLLNPRLTSTSRSPLASRAACRSAHAWALFGEPRFEWRRRGTEVRGSINTFARRLRTDGLRNTLELLRTLGHRRPRRRGLWALGRAPHALTRRRSRS